MKDIALVDIFKRLTDLLDVTDGLLFGERAFPVNHRLKGFARNKIHHIVDGVILLKIIVHPYDVRIVESPDHLGLTEELFTEDLDYRFASGWRDSYS